MTQAPTEILPNDAAGIARAAALLRDGQLVAFATETVYGLGADATVADLARDEVVGPDALAEALHYRIETSS